MLPMNTHTAVHAQSSTHNTAASSHVQPTMLALWLPQVLITGLTACVVMSNLRNTTVQRGRSRGGRGGSCHFTFWLGGAWPPHFFYSVLLWPIHTCECVAWVDNCATNCKLRFRSRVAQNAPLWIYIIKIFRGSMPSDHPRYSGAKGSTLTSTLPPPPPPPHFFLSSYPSAVEFTTEFWHSLLPIILFQATPQ